MTLDELRLKWFLPIGGSDNLMPPMGRHPASTLLNYTDGNRVTLLIDGEKFMGEWNANVTKATGLGSGSIYLSGWRLEGVQTLGQGNPDSDALKMLSAANAAGVEVRIMLSYHGGGTASSFNVESSIWLEDHKVQSACLDNRYPQVGSNHIKATIIKWTGGSAALLGSFDISKTRWDTTSHLLTDSRRDPIYGKQTHDTGVKLEGPAVADVENAFRDRWNDSSRTFGLLPLNISQPPISGPTADAPAAGSHSVQAVMTFGMCKRFYGYSWSPVGEFTAWASWLRAVKTAKRYIYIEDQYFSPFGYPPYAPMLFPTGPPNFPQQTDAIFQLGQAIQRGVHVIVLVPSNREDRAHRWQKFQRDLGVKYLKYCEGIGPGSFTIASLEVGGSPVYVHSKLLIADDEFVLIGSMNVGQRAMTCDSELSIGVVDEAETLARQFRTTLWAEHLEVLPDGLNDIDQAITQFRAAVAGTAPGRLRLYPYVDPTIGWPPLGHELIIKMIDPYNGPPR
jgi:phosphatidylserine/phosphatidylglycerophosphate/cardiolipin synthase-like enzyme